MGNEYTFGELEAEKLHEALALIRDVFLEYQAPDYSDEGVQEFMRFIEPQAIRNMLSKNEMRIWACDCGGEITGVLAAGSRHIYLLFVSGQHHRKGIAKRLLDMMIKTYSPPEITVNSSPYALTAYQKLGFADTDIEQVVNGMRFIPMKCVL